MHNPNPTQPTALVIGASLAGLLAARVLADHFDQVTLLERDTWPAPGHNRKGVPQGHHTHILLERGRKIIEGLLPGFSDALLTQQAVHITDASRDVRWFYGEGYHQPGLAGFSGLGVSRPTLEAAVRRQVLALPNVQAMTNVDVRGLLTDAAQKRVTGVSVHYREQNCRHDTLAADLVVDASGRGSRSPEWLAALGYPRPEEDSVRIDMGYTTCLFRRRPEHIPGLEGIVILATPPDRRLAVLLAQDNNRWVLTQGGYLGDHVPAALPALLAAARELPTREIYEVVQAAEPLGDPVAYKFPANLRRRYDQLPTFPEGYLIMGDALCSFNPIYAQGMTVAALEAEALAHCLAHGRTRLAVRFFAKAYPLIDAAWQTAVGADLAFAEIEGPRPPLTRFLNWYIARLHRAARHDAQVSVSFLKVINMLAPPPSILHPRILWRVFKRNWHTSGPASQPTLETSTPARSDTPSARESG